MITPEHKEDVTEYIREKIEDAGGALTAESFIEALWEHWDDVIDPVKVERKALRHELQQLRENRQAARDAITSMTTRIDEIQVILNG